LLEGFEQRRVFVLARVLSFIGIAALSIFVLAGLILWSGSLLPANVQVLPTEVAAVLSPSNAANTSEPSTEAPLAGITIPSRVSRYLGDRSNKSVLEGWLRSLEPNQRQEFVDNLEDVIKYAEQNNLDVVQAVNTYKELKMQRYRAAETKGLDTKISRYGAVGGMVSAAMLIVALSLVLVVLAIERNTRPQLAAGNSR
jgi:hypothetical protein